MCSCSLPTSSTTPLLGASPPHPSTASGRTSQQSPSSPAYAFIRVQILLLHWSSTDAFVCCQSVTPAAGSRPDAVYAVIFPPPRQLRLMSKGEFSQLPIVVLWHASTQRSLTIDTTIYLLSADSLPSSPMLRNKVNGVTVMFIFSAICNLTPCRFHLILVA